jgi:hypothetical protein
MPEAMHVTADQRRRERQAIARLLRGTFELVKREPIPDRFRKLLDRPGQDEQAEEDDPRRPHRTT